MFTYTTIPVQRKLNYFSMLDLHNYHYVTSSCSCATTKCVGVNGESCVRAVYAALVQKQKAFIYFN